ncbi:MAG TPA: secretin N-terminal domain-containing protein [Anaeromyxobacter sp.]|nr:secretin N-terminal domain-containing protein [Anaeromyxobacter sp.]
MRPSVRRLYIPVLFALVASCATDRLHREGVQAFQAGNYEEAFASMEEAVRKDPSDLKLRLELRVRREAAVQQLLAAGDAARLGGDGGGAVASYKRALGLEPGNDRALHGLEQVEADRRHAERMVKAEQLFAAKKLEAAEQEARAVLAEDPNFAAASALLSRIGQAKAPVVTVARLRTREDRPVTLQFRDAQLKVIFEALARQTGINFVFDKDVKGDAKTTIFVNQVSPEQAIELVLAQNQLARQVLSDNVALVYPDTPAKQKDYRDEIVHTFYLTNAAPKDVESLLKTVLGTKTLFVDERSSTVVIRDTTERVAMAEKLVAALDVPEPEVVMEVEVLEISHSLAEQLGINYPSNISFSATKPLNSTGTATAAGGASGLVLSDLGKQSSNTIAVSSLGVSVDLLKTVGSTNVLSSPRIRARNKEKAKILVGDRLPVVTSGTSATSGGTFSTSNVQYVDVGLTLEVQPTIHNDGNVAIKISLEVSSILKEINVPIGNGGTTLAYEIGTRNASTVLELRDGETQVLAGLIQDSDQRNSTHIPLLGDLPILGRLFGSTGKTRDKSEIVLSIKPLVIRTQPRASSEALEFWFGSETLSRSAPFASFAPAGPAAPASAAAPMVPGGVSFSGGAAIPAAAPPSGPRAVPSRIDSAAGPAPSPPPAPGATAPATPGTPGTANPAAPEAKAQATGRSADGVAASATAQGAADAGPRVTIEGPDTAKVGDEVAVSVKLASTAALGRIRTQVAFDATALQLVSAEPGDLASAGEAPKVETRPGGVQLDLAGSQGAPVSGGGGLLDLRFRVVAVRPAIAVSTQVVLIGEDGAAVAATQATPLRIAVTK